MRVGLVLGAGGTVGMAFHAGVLRALADAGWDPASAELVVGTSAGSVIGSYLRAGESVDAIWQRGRGARLRNRRGTMERTWQSRGELARRAVGSAVVTGRAALRVPGFGFGPAIARSMRAGFFSSGPAIDRFRADLGSRWPSDPLWVVAVDAGRGRRIVFGRDGDPVADPGVAVAASCAVPGMFEPVYHDGMVLIDGGVRSTTNLDLVAGLGFDVVVCAAPMAFEPTDAPPVPDRTARLWATRALAAEARKVRARGAEVLLVRPTAAQLARHGRNAMRLDVGDDVSEGAREMTAALLERRGGLLTATPA